MFNIGMLIQLLLFREDAHNKASFFQFENIPIFEFANRGNWVVSGIFVIDPAAIF